MNSSESLGVDRISNLPDEVLIHILSFLSAKQAVQTCVFAKRWTNLWASVPVLRLTVDEFQNDCPDREPRTAEERRKSVHRFGKFLNGVFDNREQTSLDSVRYSCHLEDTMVPIAWLHHVSLLNPREIHISIDNCRSRDLPDSIFSCASLEYLEIYLNVRQVKTITPAAINLPSLKYLKLGAVILYDDFTQKLFMGCRALECLYLTDCYLYCSSISSKVLKKLVINRCYQFGQMQISCPGLITLSIGSQLTRGILLKSLAFLTDAYISLWYQNFGNEDLPNLNLLNGLSNATNLVLSVRWPGMKEQLNKDIPKCKNFYNLKKLTIVDMSRDFDLVVCLLKHSPKLKVLNLQLHENQGDSHGQGVLGDVSFQHDYLKTINIYGLNRSKLLAIELINILSVYVKKIGQIFVH